MSTSHDEANTLRLMMSKRQPDYYKAKSFRFEATPLRGTPLLRGTPHLRGDGGSTASIRQLGPLEEGLCKRFTGRGVRLVGLEFLLGIDGRGRGGWGRRETRAGMEASGSFFLGGVVLVDFGMDVDVDVDVNLLCRMDMFNMDM